MPRARLWPDVDVKLDWGAETRAVGEFENDTKLGQKPDDIA
jgi:hypothetical protein